MRAIILISIITLLAGCRKTKYDSTYHKLEHDGQKRQYLLHIPDNFDEQTNKSLVIALHGGVGTPKNIEEQSLLSEVSDEEGFLVCYPKGIGRTWNAGTCCGKASKNDIDDVGFISTLIDELVAEYDIDTKRVYITGMSNGGFMSYRLACEIPEKIAAIAPVAASMVATSCSPSEAVSIIHFHSYVDNSVPIQGGGGNGISTVHKAPVDSVMNIWNSYNNCLLSDSLVHTGLDYDHKIWTNCNNNTEIELYVTWDGGHSWPMGTQPRATADNPSQTLDTSRLLWQFFDKHPKL